MLKTILLTFLLSTTVFSSSSEINFSGSMTVGYMDTENFRDHLITGSDYNNGIGSFELGKLEFYLDAPLSKEIVVSTQLNWNGDSSPTIELSYLRFEKIKERGLREGEFIWVPDQDHKLTKEISQVVLETLGTY